LQLFYFVGRFRLRGSRGAPPHACISHPPRGFWLGSAFAKESATVTSGSGSLKSGICTTSDFAKESATVTSGSGSPKSGICTTSEWEVRGTFGSYQRACTSSGKVFWRRLIVELLTP